MVSLRSIYFIKNQSFDPIVKLCRSTVSLDPEALEGRLSTGRIPSFDPPAADPP